MQTRVEPWSDALLFAGTVMQAPTRCRVFEMDCVSFPAFQQRAYRITRCTSLAQLSVVYGSIKGTTSRWWRRMAYRGKRAQLNLFIDARNGNREKKKHHRGFFNNLFKRHTIHLKPDDHKIIEKHYIQRNSSTVHFEVHFLRRQIQKVQMFQFTASLFLKHGL